MLNAVRPCFMLRRLFGPSDLICKFYWCSEGQEYSTGQGYDDEVFDFCRARNWNSCIHLVVLLRHEVLPKNQFHIAI